MSFSRLELAIEAKSALLIGDRKGQGFSQQTMRYIPGRVLRGALADALLEHAPHPPKLCGKDCDFCTLFFHEQRAVFRNAYPGHQEGSRPIPMTVVQCKVDCSSGSSEKSPAPLYDTLATQICAKLAGSFLPLSCKNCGRRVERAGGFCIYSNRAIQKVEEFPTLEFVRVGIDRTRRTAADDILYNIAALSRPQQVGSSSGDEGSETTRFFGSVDCPSNLAEPLAKVLSRRVTRLGGATSRGLGAVSIETRSHEPPSISAVKERVRKWNEHLADLIEQTQYPPILDIEPIWKSISRQSLPQQLREGKAGFFVIDLMSDSVLPEVIASGGTHIFTHRQHYVLQPATLRYFAECDAHVELMLSYAMLDHRSGWNALWKLQRDVDIVSQAGGVFVFWTEELDKWLESLQKLELFGLGTGIHEGFGQVEICSPVHLEHQ